MNKYSTILFFLIFVVLAGCADEETQQIPTATPATIERYTTQTFSPTPRVSDDGLDLVFQGGGAKGLAHIGALKEIEAQKRPFRRLVGTSAGSIVAVLVAAGYNADEIEAIITERTADGNIIMGSFLTTPGAAEFQEELLRNSVTYRTLQDVIPDFIPASTAEEIELETLSKFLREPHYREIFSLIETGGLYSGNAFVDWLRETLNKNGRSLGDDTLAQFYGKTGVDLTIVATDADTRTMLMLNQRTAPNLPVVWAVRMSVSIPFIFQEVQWQPEWGLYRDEDISGTYIVDGGMTSNLPLELVVSQEPEILAAMALAPQPEKTLALVLDHKTLIPGLEAPRPTMTPVNNDDIENQHIAQRWQEINERTINLIDTLLNAHDHLVASTYPQHVCQLPVGGLETLEYDMSNEKVTQLLTTAQEKTRACLANIDAN